MNLEPSPLPLPSRATRILLCGVGGQGAITAARALAEAAIDEGLPVVASEVHGMSQRGGSVESSVLVGDVRSPIIAPGRADLVIALEPLEALRFAERLRPGGTMVVNTASIVPFTVAIGDIPYPTLDEVLVRLRARAGKLVVLDAHALAKAVGSARSENVVLLGAAMGSGALPFPRRALVKALAHLLHSADPRALDRAFSEGERAAQPSSPERVA